MGGIGPEQLGRWFDAHAASLVLYARQWVDGAAAEDVVQDVFCRLAGQSRRPASVRAWLFRSARNAAINQVRSQRRRRARERRPAEGRAAWFETHPGNPIDVEAAQAAVAALPEAQREIVVLRIWAGLTLAEAAEVVGSPVSTLFSRYQAGLEAIRERMEKPCRTKSN